MGPQLKVSSDRLVRPGIKPVTPGIQGKICGLMSQTTALVMSGWSVTLCIYFCFKLTTALLESEEGE